LMVEVSLEGWIEWKGDVMGEWAWPAIAFVETTCTRCATTVHWRRAH
jgi:hypothetical protein